MIRLAVSACVLLVAASLSYPILASHHDKAPGATAYELVSAKSDASVTPKVLHDDDHVKIALVTLAAGATMPEHAAPVPVTVQTISGTGSMTVSGYEHELVVGHVFHMDAHAPHALVASDGAPLVVLVHYLKGGGHGKPHGH